MRPLIYFDGTNVMLIREQDNPLKEFPPYFAVHTNCDCRSCGDYKKYLEASKKKAIRVELSQQTDVWVLDRYSDGTYTTIVDGKKTPMEKGKTYELPSGYAYEVQIRCGECGSSTDEGCKRDIPPCRMKTYEHVAIIKAQPVTEESQDDLWADVADYYSKLNALTAHTMQHPKSKYTLTRKK